MKKILLLSLFLFFNFVYIPLSFGQGIIYNADFSVEGDGFPDHTTANPPATAPASVTGGGAGPNDWVLSYTATPSSDTSPNEFSVNDGKLTSQDWGGTATFTSATIDVSGVETLDITAIGQTQGGDVQNGGSEFFEYFYILDGGTPVILDIPLSGDNSGTPVNYAIAGLDVSAASTLEVGFSFNVNGGGDGYVICSFEVDALTLLPVELISFSAKAIDSQVALSWITATELNNSHFDIEYSQDGVNFRAIDEVIGNGTTQEKQEYSYIHTAPANGANYYRLKQVDFDGAFEYSDIRVVEIERTGKVVINPSAAIAEITVQLTETTGDNNQIGIYDMMGRTVLMTNFDGALNTKTLDISNLQKGYYVVRVQAGNQVFTERFMKMVD